MKLFTKKQITSAIKITVLSAILIVGLNYANAAWSGPSATAPDGNTPAPINIGVINQIKNGGLGVNALSVFGDGLITGKATADKLCLGGCCKTSWSDNSCGAPTSTQSPTPAPVVTLTSNPTSISYNGQSTLTWSSTNATSCTASGAWSGTKATSNSSGESTGSLTSSKTYTLSCTGAGGSASGSATVTVSENKVMSGTLSNPSCTVATGKNSCDSTISWNTINPVGTSVVTADYYYSDYPSAGGYTSPGTIIATGNSGTKVITMRNTGTVKFYLKNNGVLLDEQWGVTTCAVGSTYDANMNCIIETTESLDGSCLRNHYLCASGFQDGTSVNNVETSTSWTWTCNGQNGGENVSCVELKPVLADGSCSLTQNECSSGTVANISRGTWDCNGQNGGKNVSCFCTVKEWYPDLDNDGYGAGTPVTTCSDPSGDASHGGVVYVTNNTDCYDAPYYSATGQKTYGGWTHPGQTNGFNIPNGAGNYDYNCDGTETKIGVYDTWHQDQTWYTKSGGTTDTFGYVKDSSGACVEDPSSYPLVSGGSPWTCSLSTSQCRGVLSAAPLYWLYSDKNCTTNFAKYSEVNVCAAYCK